MTEERRGAAETRGQSSPEPALCRARRGRGRHCRSSPQARPPPSRSGPPAPLGPPPPRPQGPGYLEVVRRRPPGNPRLPFYLPGQPARPARSKQDEGRGNRRRGRGGEGAAARGVKAKFGNLPCTPPRAPDDFFSADLPSLSKSFPLPRVPYLPFPQASVSVKSCTHRVDLASASPVLLHRPSRTLRLLHLSSGASFSLSPSPGSPCALP